jgi:tRNA-dihydrouridine synthase
MTWKEEERVVQYEAQLSTDSIAEAREVVTNSPLGSNGEVKILA